MSLIIRSGRYQLYRRVPRRYSSVDSRMFVKVSLRTDSKEAAEAKAAIVWEKLIVAWEAKLAGESLDAELAFSAASDLAAVRGLRYLDVSQVAQLPADRLLERFDVLNEHAVRAGRPLDRRETAAIMGGIEVPKITLTKALDLYWNLARDETLKKSADQIRRWRNPKIKAISNLIAVCGDKPIDALNRDDMLEFRDWWVERVETEGLTSSSANKDFGHVATVLKAVNERKQLGLALPVAGLSLKKGEATVRPPFSDHWIKDKLLAPGALDGLNSEARAIVHLMINTGCRPSEIAALQAEQIWLDAEIPYISIEAVEREIKTPHSRRKIVLTGISLEAIRGFEAGFPRYKTSSASLSATVNKYLRSNNLMETHRHTLYSLRHAFEDRCLAANIDERIRRDLMGHALGRERYGSGASLEQQLRLLAPIAF